MASSEDLKMDYQKFNSEENILSSDYFESSAAPKLNDNAGASALDPGIDLKNYEFDVLLSYLSNAVIFKNILAIYYFLRGQKDQIEFPGANLYLEEFLVRIVRNIEVLRSKRFTLYCKVYCNLIIDLLKNALSNRNFMVACICKNEEEYSRYQVRKNKTLIYKKLYYTSHYETQMQIFKGQTSIMAMSSTPPMSRTTSMDSLHTERSNFDAKQPNPFISHCLHLIYNFVKDQTQLTLNFSGLSKTDTVFLHSVFSSAIDEKYDNGILCKQVHCAIWEAVKICSLKFDYLLRNLRFCLSKKSLLLEKRMKRPAPTDATDGPRHTWQSKRTQKNQEFVNQFSLEFINFCLKKMLEFLTEDSITSLMVSVSTAEEKKFVKNIINYIRSPAVRSVFNDEPRRIIEQLNVLLDNKANYKLKTSGKNKFSKKNVVRFMKVPKFPVNSFQPPSNRTCTMGSTMSATSDVDDSTHVDYMSRDVETKNIWPSEESIAKEANNPPTEESPEASTSCAVEPVDNPPSEDYSVQQAGRHWYPRGETVPRNHGAIHKLYLRTQPRSKRKTGNRCRLRWGLHNTPHINSSFQPAGTVDSTDADPALTEAMRKHGISDTSDDMDHSFELIGDEDVTTPGQSTPIEIPNAMKMMVKMGWDGGALGATSSGILEPIMVSNDRNNDPRAGFGNTVQLNTKSRIVTPIPIPCVTPRIIRMMKRMGYRPQDEFREIFLTHFLDFVSYNFEDMCIELKPGINGLDLKFIINIIHNLAARTSNIELEEHEQIFFDNILVIFEGQPDMYVTAFVPLHENEIHLKRITGQGIRCHGIEARAKRFKEALLAGKELPTNMDVFMQEYGPLANDEKSYFAQILRVEFLLEVFKLVKDENLELTHFSRPLNWREKNMLRDGVMFINEKKCKYKPNAVEAVLFNLIQQHMEGCKYELNIYEFASGFQISKVSKESPPTHTNALNTAYNLKEVCGYDSVLKNDDRLYDENNEEVEPDDRENGENDVENFESKQDIDGSEDKEIIDEETHYNSEILSEGGSDDEMSSGEKENNSAKIIEYNHLNDKCNTASNIHSDEQTQAEKFDVKIVYVTIKDLFSEDTPKFIQGIIAYSIEKSKELPFLVCHGVHSDAIVYSCQTKNSYAWLLQTCYDHLFTTFTKEVDKMSLKINCYYDIMKENDLFRLIEMYNNELSTKHWIVLKTENMAGYMVFDVKMDQKSVNFILKSKMSLYAGIDTVTFSIIF